MKPSALTLLVFGLAATVAADEPRFAERSSAWGIDFDHRHFGTGEKYMPENMAPGVVVFDADGDGLLDLYLVQGAPIGPEAPASTATNKLFRQSVLGVFEDVTERAGVGDAGYGMGASAGDYDGDGDLDLYVTNYGPNVLYRNAGDGSFEEVTAQAGVGCDLWSTDSGFFDGDGDGDLDLYVVNYVDFAYDNHKWCGNAQNNTRSYCHPDVYDGQPDVYYRNEGDGRFVDASRPAGLVETADAKGLGVAFADFDGDRRPDIYVANDSTMNHLYLARGSGFEEDALFSGLGLNAAGAAEASMGIAVGDLDGDLQPEVFVTHLDQETNTLYRYAGEAGWNDRTEAAGLAVPSLPWVGFGAVFLDHDNDADLDLFVTNGHIIDNIALFDPTRSHRQPAQLFDNDGSGRFQELEGTLALPLLVGRGAAAADLDRDGDLDLVVTQNGDRALVLENVLGGDSRPPSGFLSVRPVSASGQPGAFGARIEITADSGRQMRLISSSDSYLSQGPPVASFGLGTLRTVDTVHVRWPSGKRQRFGPLPANRFVDLYEN